MEPHRLNEALKRRTATLAAANGRLRLGIVRRRAAETALRESGTRRARLLKESLLLENGLRQLARRVMDVGEADRKRISLGLRNEVAQTLLGVHVRLLLLKGKARGDARDFKREIASTQRSAATSARLMRWLTGEGAKNS